MNHLSRVFNYCLIPHPSEHRVLLESGAHGWTLPLVMSPPRIGHWAARINEELRTRLGIKVTILHWALYRCRDWGAGELHSVLAMENHSPHWTPPVDARWIGPDELDGLPLAIPDHRQALTAWFAEADGERLPAHRLPWQHAGWFAEAAAWIEGRLEQLGGRLIPPVEQLSTKYGSCLLRARTSAGDVYFKALSRMYSREPLVTLTLKELCPDNIVNVVAVDTERHWVLTLDSGTRTLAEVPDLHFWQESLQSFAQMQLSCAGSVDRLASAGCGDFRLERMRTDIDGLLAGGVSNLPDVEGGFEQTELEELRTLLPKLKAACIVLAEHAVPDSLHHGEFHPYQILATAKGAIFIDWAEAAISHPFFSLVRFLTYFCTNLTDHPLRREQEVVFHLRDAYLEPWTRFEPMERLITAYQLAVPLAALQHALSYHRLELTRQRIPWERTGMVNYFLRTLLDPRGLGTSWR